jgi:hypothetical protein
MAAGAIRLTGTRLRAGVWEGVLDIEPDTGAPAIEVVHLDRPIAGLRLTPDPGLAGRFAVAVPIPADLLSDGEQTFLSATGPATRRWTVSPSLPAHRSTMTSAPRSSFCAPNSTC